MDSYYTNQRKYGAAFLLCLPVLMSIGNVVMWEQIAAGEITVLDGTGLIYQVEGLGDVWARTPDRIQTDAPRLACLRLASDPHRPSYKLWIVLEVANDFSK